MWEKREEFGKNYTYFVIALWSACEVLFNTTIKEIFGVEARHLNSDMDLIILVLLLIQIVFFQKYSLKEFIAVATVTIFISFVVLNASFFGIMSTWIFVVVSKNLDFDKVVRIIYIVQLVMICLVFFMYAIGYLEDYTMYRGSLVRHSMGFSHPNQLGARMFLILTTRCYIRREKFNFFDWLLLPIAAYFVYVVPNSKTSVYALIMLAGILLLDIIVKASGGKQSFFSGILILSSVISMVISVTLSVINAKQYALFNVLDKVLSARFSLCHKTLRYYGISMFGQNIQLIFQDYFTGVFYHFWLDNAYMALLLRYGPIMLILFCGIYIATMLYFKNQKNYVVVEIMCLYAIYGVMENNIFLISQNVFLLLLSYPIFKYNVDNSGKIKNKQIAFTW